MRRPQATGLPDSSSSLCESNPSKQEKVAAAERAAVGQNDPVERFLDAVPDAYASKIDRLAIGTAGREHT
jgi:hypothetical protein